MSIHPNAGDSQTDGVKVEPWGKFVSHQVGVSRRGMGQHREPMVQGNKLETVGHDA